MKKNWYNFDPFLWCNLEKVDFFVSHVVLWCSTWQWSDLPVAESSLVVTVLLCCNLYHFQILTQKATACVHCLRESVTYIIMLLLQPSQILDILSLLRCKFGAKLAWSKEAWARPICSLTALDGDVNEKMKVDMCYHARLGSRPGNGDILITRDNGHLIKNFSWMKFQLCLIWVDKEHIIWLRMCSGDLW